MQLNTNNTLMQLSKPIVSFSSTTKNNMKMEMDQILLTYLFSFLLELVQGTFEPTKQIYN